MVLVAEHSLLDKAEQTYASSPFRPRLVVEKPALASGIESVVEESVVESDVVTPAETPVDTPVETLAETSVENSEVRTAQPLYRPGHTHTRQYYSQVTTLV